MTESQTDDASRAAGHECIVCQGRAHFCFATARIEIWTCLKHRSTGQEHLTAPDRRLEAVEAQRPGQLL